MLTISDHKANVMRKGDSHKDTHAHLYTSTHRLINFGNEIDRETTAIINAGIIVFLVFFGAGVFCYYYHHHHH